MMKMLEPISIPFLLAVNGDTKVNKTRVVEAVVIAIVVGAIMAYAGMYVALPVIKEQIEQINRRQTEQTQFIRDIKQELDLRAARRDQREAEMNTKITQVQIEMARRR